MIFPWHFPVTSIDVALGVLGNEINVPCSIHTTHNCYVICHLFQQSSIPETALWDTDSSNLTGLSTPPVSKWDNRAWDQTGHYGEYDMVEVLLLKLSMRSVWLALRAAKWDKARLKYLSSFIGCLLKAVQCCGGGKWGRKSFHGSALYYAIAWHFHSRGWGGKQASRKQWPKSLSPVWYLWVEVGLMLTSSSAVCVVQSFSSVRIAVG